MGKHLHSKKHNMLIGIFFLFVVDTNNNDNVGFLVWPDRPEPISLPLIRAVVPHYLPFM